MIFLGLAACAANPIPKTGDSVVQSETLTPTVTLRPTLTATLDPTSSASTVLPPTADASGHDSGTVTGEVCYPGSETPPMTVFLENTATDEITSLKIERGQTSYSAELPVGAYTAYARTDGMNLQGEYACDSAEPCDFRVEAGQTATIDLCSWYDPPGIRPSPADQPAGDVWVKLLQNMNARTGPHLSEPELGLVEAGAVVEAIARSADGQWLKVTHPKVEQTGWLHTPLTQIFGDPSILPIEGKADTPAPEQQWFVPAIWQSEANPSLVLFKGEIRDENERPVNGFSILLDNGTWSVLSHPTGASHHYPEVFDGEWDVIIDNETDAAGWWTMTVVRYECPDFETGFNAQCKQFTPLSETKVIRVIHPDDNIIEANWTCLEQCDQGIYVKSYRRPVKAIPGNLLLYAEDRALKSSPVSSVFDQPEMRRLYDSLPETFEGLKAYLAEHRPLLSANGNSIIIPSPEEDSPWLADLETDTLREQDPQITASTATEQPEKLLASIDNEVAQQRLATTTAWALSHDQQKIGYTLQFGSPLQNDIYVFDLETKSHTLIGPINGYVVSELRWTADDDLLVIGANNPKFPSGGAIFTIRPEPDTLPEILLESDTAYLVDVFPEEGASTPNIVGGTIPKEVNTMEMEITREELELENYRWQNRLLLIFAPDTTDSDYRRQRAWLEEQELRDRDLLVFYFFDQDPGYLANKLIPVEAAAVAQEQFEIDPEQFAVILIGKDGGVNLRSDQPTAPIDLFALIDAMPMRQREMQQKKQK